MRGEFSRNTFSPTKTDAILGIKYNFEKVFFLFFSSGKYSCNCGLQIQILSNGDLLACSRLARSKLDVPGYQLVPS